MISNITITKDPIVVTSLRSNLFSSFLSLWVEVSISYILTESAVDMNLISNIYGKVKVNVISFAGISP